MPFYNILDPAFTSSHIMTPTRRQDLEKGSKELKILFDLLTYVSLLFEMG